MSSGISYDERPGYSILFIDVGADAKEETVETKEDFPRYHSCQNFFLLNFDQVESRILTTQLVQKVLLHSQQICFLSKIGLKIFCHPTHILSLLWRKSQGVYALFFSGLDSKDPPGHVESVNDRIVLFSSCLGGGMVLEKCLNNCLCGLAGLILSRKPFSGRRTLPCL